MTTRAALYLRQSLDVQEGIERQRKRCAHLVSARGWEIGPEYADNDTSASKRRGPGTAWAEMLEDVGSAFDVIVAVDLDRLLRSTADLLELTNRGARVVTVDGEIDLSTADGEFRATMLAGIARFEVRRKGERQQRANQQRADQGKSPSGVRLTGYTTNGQKIRKREAELVRDIFKRFAEGESLKGLADRMTAAGVKTRRGGAWSPSTIRTMLMNPRYAGLAVYRGVRLGTQGDWPAIVPLDTFEAVQARLNDPRRKTNRLGTARKYLGSGIYQCGVCGRPLRTNGPRYWCPEGGHVTRSLVAVDDFVRLVMAARLRAPEARELLAVREHAIGNELADTAGQLRARLATIEADYDAGHIDGRRFRVAAEKVSAELRAVEIKQAQAFAGAVAGPILGATDPPTAFLNASLDQQRAVVDALMTVTLHPVKQGRKGFDPNSVQIEWKRHPSG